MNQFAPGSATSFSSGLRGGNAEHSRRWALVRDPQQGVCMVFVTPEKVHKSKKLQNEMQKLFNQGRLGRFVIDECHCACQWGHDFRPDYGQLGILKAHFPSIPLVAVTATASDKVRADVCQILKLGTNYKFFRSTALRPNLHYSVVCAITRTCTSSSELKPNSLPRHLSRSDRKEMGGTASSLTWLRSSKRSIPEMRVLFTHFRGRTPTRSLTVSVISVSKRTHTIAMSLRTRKRRSIEAG